VLENYKYASYGLEAVLLTLAALVEKLNTLKQRIDVLLGLFLMLIIGKQVAYGLYELIKGIL
jgi:hypothetical protein|tara:strand:- start:4228 stop:4413 length:186 start_codon:yes stop_codon:yes gene_type:complete